MFVLKQLFTVIRFILSSEKLFHCSKSRRRYTLVSKFAQVFSLFRYIVGVAPPIPIQLLGHCFHHSCFEISVVVSITITNHWSFS